MNVVGKVGSLITQGVYSVAIPFHPFGGAVDIIVVQQQDGSYRSTPWYVRFGKFQGVLNGAEKVVRIEVNGVECDVHMYLDSSGEAYFVKDAEANNGGFKLAESFERVQEDDTSDHNYNETRKNHDDDISRQHCYDSSTGAFELRDKHVALGINRLERIGSDSELRLYDFEDVQSSFEGSAELSEYGSSRYDDLDMEHVLDSQISSSEVVLVSIDGYMITAPISLVDRHIEDVELGTPQSHLGPGEGANLSGPDTQYTDDEALQAADYFSDTQVTRDSITSDVSSSRSYSDIADQQLKICQGGGKVVEGTHDTSVHVREMQVGNELEHAPTRAANKDDFCKSCLQLRELTMQDGGLSQQDIGSSIENPEAAEDFQDSSTLTSLTVEEAKDRQSGSLTIEHDVLSDSGTFISNTSTDVQFQVEAHRESVLEPDAIDTDRRSEHSIIANEEGEVNSYVINGVQVPKSIGESSRIDGVEPQTTSAGDALDTDLGPSMELSLCRNLLCAGMGSSAAAETFDEHRISVEDYKLSMASIVKNENLVVRIHRKYVPWDKAAPIILGLVVYGLKLPVGPSDAISVEQEGTIETNETSGISSTPAGRGWRLWPLPYGRANTMEHASSQSPNKDAFTDSESASNCQPEDPSATPRGRKESVRKPLMRTNVPTSEQIESLNLKEGQNMVTFISFSRVLGPQKVEAHIYLWKWNARIVISDVDGTITKSDVLGQFMPLFGKDWTHSGIARLFSAIKENGYQLLFLSARAIVQAYLTKNFLLNLNQDGKTLPVGPVVISPDGLFPSLYREVIRRAPHEFKIACLEDINSLFPPDYNPFYAGFGNRDTDELSYRKIGIPRGKIFIINPKGEVAINRRIDVKSYSSLHTLVNDMFPPTSLVDEQEEFNPWNYWKMPLPDIDGL